MDARIGKAKRRGPGRRPAGSQVLGRDEILARALELTKTVALQDLSIVRLASELGVTPASIHYYLDGRDDLTSGVVNLFIRDLVAGWPALSGRWSADLEAVARAIYRQFLGYPGISVYFAIQNRFRVLIPAAELDDHGALFGFLDRYFAAIRAVGLDAGPSAKYAVLLVQFIHMTAHQTAHHHWPGEQSLLSTYLTELDRGQFPNIAFMRGGYLKVAGDDVFEAGLRLILAGLAAERRGRKRKG
jgi:AcrR family transcriptional regulator